MKDIAIGILGAFCVVVLLVTLPLWCGCEPPDRSRYVELVYCYAAQIPSDNLKVAAPEREQNAVSATKLQSKPIEFDGIEPERESSGSPSATDVVSPAALQETTEASNPRSESSADTEARGRSEPAAVQVKKPPFYEIILHTGDNCAPCDVLKHELKLRGIPFKEHRVKSGTVPTAWIDGVEYVGASEIYQRLEIQRTK